MKKKIETVQGPDVYPAAQQMLIFQGKVLKDDTTLEGNKVTENSFVVIMVTKVSLVGFDIRCCKLKFILILMCFLVYSFLTKLFFFFLN